MNYLCLFLSVILPGAVSSQCRGEPTGGLSGTSRLSPLEAPYAQGHKLVFKCQSDGFGYITLACRSNNQWSSADRNCKDDPPFEIGGGMGVACAALTTLVVVVFIIVSTLKQKKEHQRRPSTPPPPPAQLLVAHSTSHRERRMSRVLRGHTTLETHTLKPTTEED